MAKLGQPTKITEKIKKQIMGLSKLGLTDKEIAAGVGIAEKTIHNWKKKYPEFFEALKNTKKEADKKVELSLFQRACGYEHDDEQLFFDKMSGEVIREKIIKKYPPDVAACIFWLKNRQPDKWRDKTEVNLNQRTVTRIKKSFDGTTNSETETEDNV